MFKNYLISIPTQNATHTFTLPHDPFFDKTIPRHKHFVFHALMIVCEVETAWYKNNMTEIQKEIDKLKEEL
jgi:hypothetical protein